MRWRSLDYELTEPAGQLPLPREQLFDTAWPLLESSRFQIDELVVAGQWQQATALVDDQLLLGAAGLSRPELALLWGALLRLRNRCQRRNASGE